MTICPKIFKFHNCSQTFKGDERALVAARNKINEEFKKNKHVQNEGSIDELVKMAIEVQNELKANVIQAKEKEPGVYGNELSFSTDHVVERRMAINENQIFIFRAQHN